jgi:hypothetical protein
MTEMNLVWPPWSNDDALLPSQLRITGQTNIKDILLIKRGTRILAVKRKEYLYEMHTRISKNEELLVEYAFSTLFTLAQTEKYIKMMQKLDTGDTLVILDLNEFELDLSYSCLLT